MGGCGDVEYDFRRDTRRDFRRGHIENHEKNMPTKIHKKAPAQPGLYIIFIILLIRIPQVVDLLGFRKILLVCFLL